MKPDSIKIGSFYVTPYLNHIKENLFDDWWPEKIRDTMRDEFYVFNIFEHLLRPPENLQFLRSTKHQVMTSSEERGSPLL
jgi:hypothetical protein